MFFKKNELFAKNAPIKVCNWCSKVYKKKIFVCSKQWANSRFCSVACSSQWGAENNDWTNCSRLAKKRQGNGQQYGKNNCNWRGGRQIRIDGWVRIWIGRGKPMADTKGYAMEHRIVMAKYLGRSLGRYEVVHHKNGNKQDNQIKNLILFKNQAEHIKYHRSLHPREARMKKYI